MWGSYNSPINSARTRNPKQETWRGPAGAGFPGAPEAHSPPWENINYPTFPLHPGSSGSHSPWRLNPVSGFEELNLAIKADRGNGDINCSTVNNIWVSTTRQALRCAEGAWKPSWWASECSTWGEAEEPSTVRGLQTHRGLKNNFRKVKSWLFMQI